MAVLELLVYAGADLNARTFDGLTPYGELFSIFDVSNVNRSVFVILYFILFKIFNVIVMVGGRK
jgi:hypothetical protein